MQIAIVSVPINHQWLIGQRPYDSGKVWWNGSAAVMGGYRSKLLTIRLCSSAPSTSVDESASVASESGSIDDAVKLPLGGCKACGREEVEKGCNEEGRIQGGIATVPGFGWWPIKAYRPCPGFVASGGRYRRRGQSIDEVAFGRGDSGQSMD